MATPVPQNEASLTAWSAAAATGGRIVRVAGEGRRTRGITSDSRAVSHGSAFVALRGDRYDGHDYLAAAAAAGASLAIVERGRGQSDVALDVVEVPDTLVAWGDLARAHIRAWRRNHDRTVVVAITGTAGKTTTKDLCAALLRVRGECHATHGNLNNRVGVPAVAFGLRPQHAYGVFEAGMSVRGEIAELARILEPDIALITNVGLAHAEGVGGTRADVAREKGDLLARLDPPAVAIVRHEDAAAVGQLARTRARRVFTFGTTDGADYRLLRRESTGPSPATLLIERRLDRSILSVRLPLLGEAAALNLLGALAAAECAAGPLTGEDVTRALAAHLLAPTGRLQIRHLPNGITLVDDTYNANPTSVRAALHTLSELVAGGRGIFVLGEMRELGPSAAEAHIALGEAIAQSGAAIAVSCGGLADLAVDAAAKAGVETIRAADVDEAASVVGQLAVSGDVILVKASRSVGAERVVEALVRAFGTCDSDAQRLP